ncbi:MAG: hypothetical protein A3G20_07830 [Acidobacteria bacterium RIFCSPLOWO2_12_FULL_59_11]|nr:MAG: hypothetical protein A3G20_07830 [Acidobacteria bacterium RIFCSPLOWO2_12_FULL_59_11]
MKKLTPRNPTTVPATSLRRTVRISGGTLPPDGDPSLVCLHLATNWLQKPCFESMDTLALSQYFVQQPRKQNADSRLKLVIFSLLQKNVKRSPKRTGSLVVEIYPHGSARE